MFSNRYIQRKVAENDARACFICYRPTTAVMVNEDGNVDFFYACPAHLDDPGFASMDQATQAALKEQERKQQEIDNLRKEWEEVQSKKQKTSDSSAPPLPPPPQNQNSARIRRVYELNRGVYNLRLGAKRRVAQERKTQAMLSNPDLFPSAPKHSPG